MKVIYRDVLIGADPELFLKESNGHFVSSIDKIGGTKYDPRPIDEFGNSVQEDNVAVEYNITPAKTRDAFIFSNQKVLSYLEEHVKKLGLSFAKDAAAFFPDEELQDYRALTFGCEPDYNAWTGNENPPIEVSEEFRNLRSAGGHIHVGYENPNRVDSDELVKAMDVFLGCQSIKYDEDTLRRKLYGKAGSCRYKQYGVEYRTLSGFWIHSPEMQGWAFDQTHKAIDFLNKGNRIDDKHAEIISQCVNNADDSALSFIERKYGS